MALVKCKECGHEISKKADSCPNCGAKPPAKTSAFTWIVLTVIILFVWIANQEPSTTSKLPAASNSTSPNKSGSNKPKPVLPSWRHSTSSDEMTGEVQAFAFSPRTGATDPMNFPYRDVEAQLSVGCNAKSEWAYFWFSTAPNLNNTDTQDGWNLIKTRTKWDDEIVTTELTQDWGSQFLQFRGSDSAEISSIEANSTVLLELDWHGNDETFFEFTLRGSSAALTEIRTVCRSLGQSSAG